MKYYSFDDAKREVVIHRYDTPTPWMNYLSNGTFHTMMSQAGGALAFYRSPQIWRINRYRFYNLPTDRSGMYLYLRDPQNGSYWCPTSEPAAMKPDQWEARHGMGYTCFSSSRDGLEAELTYLVGPLENNLIWNLELKNTTDLPINRDLFAYVEYGMMEYMREISWACYMKHQMSVWYDSPSEVLIFKYGVENQPKPLETPLVYLCSDTALSGFDGDRDEFVGTYRSESNPVAVERGRCGGSTMFGGDPCGALQIKLNLEPGETRIVNIFLGTGDSVETIQNSVVRSRESGFVERSKQELKIHWETFLTAFQCQVPDKQAERMINTWTPYQVERNFQFSRNISYYATGTFRGVGFRDTAQDILAMIPFDISRAKEKIVQLLGQQYQDGHANHYFFPNEGWDPVTSIHSDDHLWPILSVYDLIMEEGALDFLEVPVPYYDGGSASVYRHLQQAVDYTMKHLGERGFPLMLRSDWNDQLFRVCRAGKGESIWTAMQFGTALLKMEELALLLNDDKSAQHYRKVYLSQQTLVNSLGWDGEWFRRAIMDNGQYLGTVDNPEAKLWLNTQTWSVISEMGDREKCIQAMDTVFKVLDTPLGIKKLHPSITTFPSPEDPLTNYNKGTGENGAVFCHANTWAIIAECMLGRGDRAWKYYRQLIPAVAMEQASPARYKAEPYVYASNLFGPESDKFGLANVSWLTGTAAWMYIAATRYILGIQPTWKGLEIKPCLPSDWTSATVNRRFRGRKYRITIAHGGNEVSEV